MVLQRSGVLPPRESCDLLVLDRSVDPVAPVVHEWTYEAMVYDLLPVDENVIRWAWYSGFLSWFSCA
jgi:syntaxin-binding protein 1